MNYYLERTVTIRGREIVVKIIRDAHNKFRKHKLIVCELIMHDHPMFGGKVKSQNGGMERWFFREPTKDQINAFVDIYMAKLTKMDDLFGETNNLTSINGGKNESDNSGAGSAPQGTEPGPYGKN